MDALDSPATILRGSLGSAIARRAETSTQRLAGTMDQLVLSATPPMAQVKTLDYSLQVRIGTGTSGDVYRARCKETDRVYAVKIYKEATSPQGFLWNHEHVVQVFSFTDCFEMPTLVMEYLELGDLRQHVWSFDATDIATILKQVLGACSYLHDFNLVHLDIKPSNILVKSKFPVHVKLADMDGVKRPSQDKAYGGFTSLYAAPEVLRGEPFDTRADIWSLGVMAVKLMVLNGLPVQRSVQTWAQDIRSNLRFLSNATVYHFVSKLLELRPQRRFSAREALNHRFWDLGSEAYDEMRPSPLWKSQVVDENLVDTQLVADTEPFSSASSVACQPMSRERIRKSERQTTVAWPKRAKRGTSRAKVQKR